MSHSGTHKSPARDNNTEVSGARTLPESLTTSHKGLATFKTELNAALVGDQQKLTYASVKVLLLNWELQDLGKVIFEETKELEAVFTDFYGFATETYCIPGQLAGRNLQLKLIQVLLEVEGGGPGGAKLLIVYYNGYGSMEKDGRLFWTAKKRWDPADNNDPKWPALLWNDLQGMLEAADLDVLFLFDCGHATHAATKGRVPGAKEVFAGSAREIIVTGPGFGTVNGSPFTQSLIKHLKAGARRPHGYLVAELQAEFNVEPILEKQPPSRVVLTGHRRPLRLEPLDPKLHASPQAVSPSQSRRVLLAVSLQEGIFSAPGNRVRWAEWLSGSPDLQESIEIEEVIKVEAAFHGRSSLLLISIPIEMLARLPSDPTYTFVGFIESDNLLRRQAADSSA